MQFNHSEDFYSDNYLSKVLLTNTKIALVGASDKEHRASFGVMKFLLDRGYDVTPVAPRLAGKTLLGQKVYGSLIDIPHSIDMVDIFRNSEDAGSVVDEAIEIKAKSVWLQLKIINHEAAKRAEQAGLSVVMNRCPAIEIPRLNLEPIT